MPDKRPSAPQDDLRAPPQPVQASLDGPMPEADAAKGGGLSAKKLILIGLVPLIALAGIGGGLYYTGMLNKFFAKKTAVTAEGGKAEEGKGESKESEGGEGSSAAGSHFLEIPNMLVNLSSNDGSARYLRLSVQLELNSDTDKKAVQAVLPRVVDQFQTYLRELRIKDLRGSAGIYRLQTELLARVNAAAYPVEVKDVLFQEILIQ